jgi:hypothetical protein
VVARAKLVISGSLGAGNVERWSVGLNYGPGTQNLPDTPPLLQVWADAVATALGGLSTSTVVRSWLSSVGSITDVAAYYYPGPGPADATAVSTDTLPLPGTVTIALPPQCTQAITLETGFAGRRYRGRIFWPRLTGTVQTTLKMNQTQSTSDDFAAMLRLTESNGTDLTAYALSVYSEAGDFLTPVSSISIGDVVDTQRRRRDALVETRVRTVL